MGDIETAIRTAAEQRRRVIIRYRSPHGTEYEREMEPYVLNESELVAFEYFNSEFRTLPLSSILELEITSRHFEPRREVEMPGKNE
jgi:predicted DNA-binding transcriptional regulator YafY